LLTAGTHIGPYEILALLGAGGMGEVYRGRDPRLGREVAIKVLPLEFSADPDRLRRFEQEARAAAALNHPNILAVYDIGQHDGSPYIVSELLEGETLRSKLRAPLQVREAVECAVQIVRGLAAAHDKGIVHRDLKPENIFVTADRRVKILDFGLAKLVQPATPAHADDAATATRNTPSGFVLGTIGYMAPEQVRGQDVDHRSDIFALGTILYELLSGRRAFEGPSSADTMTAILREHPPAVTDANPRVPSGLGRVIERCLEKSPAARFQSTHDLAFALEDLSTRSDVTATIVPSSPPPSSSRWRAWLLPLLVMTVLAAALVGGFLLRRSPPPPVRSVRFLVEPPGSVTFSLTGSGFFVAVSPDGSRLAFVATGPTGTPILWVRPLDSLIAQPVSQTEYARSPFWSPDSRFIGFVSAGKLRKVPVSGGPPQTIADTSEVLTGATWNLQDEILFSTLAGPIRRVLASGGTSTPVGALDAAREEIRQSFPSFLPDGRHFVYYAQHANPQHDGIYVKGLDADDARVVVHARSTVGYVEPGYLVYAHDGVLLAHPFDAKTATTTGEPVPISERVEQFPETGGAAFSSSPTGVLVYGDAPQASSSGLAWFDRSGKELGSVGDPARYRNPRLSPVGKRIAVEIVDISGNRDIWLIDVARGVPVRFTFDPGRDASPVWSPDGRTIAWQGATKMQSKPSSGTGQEQTLRDDPWIPDDWLPDGSGLFCHQIQPRQIMLLPLVGQDRTPRPVIQGRSITTHARVSPDGRWVAYANVDTGRFDIYLQRASGAAGKWLLSSNGGIQPKWRGDGKEIFYVATDGMLMAVPVQLGELAEIGKPQPLFQTHVEAITGSLWHQYDVTSDGQRFLVNTPQPFASTVTVVVNGPAALKQ
jgi:serine/threonine protein kinase